jgi:hypothetical protein
MSDPLARALFGGLMMMLLAGCGEQGRYQLVSMPPSTVWRIDTVSGELEACGYESGKPVCHSFPAPPQRKK